MRYFSFFVMSIILCNVCVAEQTYVYRADARYMSDIKAAGGFIAQGDNGDLLAHVDGISCFLSGDDGGEGTRFISTTRSRDFAIEWGRTLASETSHGYVMYYVYEIRPDSNMYDLYNTLEDWIDHFVASQRTDRYQIASALERANELYEDQQEIIALRRINFSQVRQAWVYRIGPDTNNQPIFVHHYDNPDYEDRATDINISPYRQYVAPDLSHHRSVPVSTCGSCLSSNSTGLRELSMENKKTATLPQSIIRCRHLFSYLFLM